MLRKLSLVAVAAVSLGAAALAPTSASAWAMVTTAAGTTARGVRASMSAVPATVTDMAAATRGDWSRLPGDPLAAGQPLLLIATPGARPCRGFPLPTAGRFHTYLTTRAYLPRLT